MTDLPPQKLEYGTFKSYGLGFVLSLLLTFGAYFLVVEKMIPGIALDLTIGALAIIQATIQFFLFFNLSKEPKPRWNLLVFLFMIMVVGILVFGSIWIMNNLNYHLMGP